MSGNLHVGSADDVSNGSSASRVLRAQGRGSVGVGVRGRGDGGGRVTPPLENTATWETIKWDRRGGRNKQSVDVSHSWGVCWQAGETFCRRKTSLKWIFYNMGAFTASLVCPGLFLCFKAAQSKGSPAFHWLSPPDSICLHTQVHLSSTLLRGKKERKKLDPGGLTHEVSDRECNTA